MVSPHCDNIYQGWIDRYSSWQLEDTNHLQKETFEEYYSYHKAKKSHCFTKAKGRWKYSVLTTSFGINASWKCQRENEHTLKNQGNILCEEKLSVLMEARWIFIFNSTDFCSSSQGQCLKKYIWGILDRLFQWILFLLLLFSSLLLTFQTSFIPWNVNECSIINYPVKALPLHQSGNLAWAQNFRLKKHNCVLEEINIDLWKPRFEWRIKKALCL